MGFRKVRKKSGNFKVRFFQNTTKTKTTQQLEENNHNSSLYSDVLIFEQRNEFGVSITRKIFSKQSENSTIQLIKCVDSTIRKDTTSEQSNKYFNIHLCPAAKLLRDCIGGAYLLMKF